MQISIKPEGLAKLRQRLKTAAEKLKDMRPLWSSVGMYVQRQTIKERFDKEQTPEGEKWEPLAPTTIKRKKRHKRGQMKILHDTGELRKSITYEAGNDHVKIGSKLKYARTHQFGRGKIPARRFLGVTEGEKEHISSMLNQYVKRHIFGGG